VKGGSIADRRRSCTRRAARVDALAERLGNDRVRLLAAALPAESLERLEATRVVIAHRLSTIVNADRICVLEGGQIVEMGTYAELLERDGLFARLARRQMA